MPRRAPDLPLLPLLLVLAAPACGGDAPEAPPESAEPEPAPTAGERDVDPALAQVRAFLAGANVDRHVQGWRTRMKRPPQLEFSDNREYVWILETNVGTLELRLMPEVAPMHVSSCIYLTEAGFYDGLSFHRVMSHPPFMAQGGSPLSAPGSGVPQERIGTGGPGYRMAGELDPAVRHDERGILSTANAGPGTDGSQFFITFAPTPNLDMRYTIYGKVVRGWDTLDRIEALGVAGDGPPTEPIVIEKARVRVD